MQAAGLEAHGIKQNAADGQGSSLRRWRSTQNVLGAFGICVKCKAGRRFQCQTVCCVTLEKKTKKNTNADGLHKN